MARWSARYGIFALVAATASRAHAAAMARWSARAAMFALLAATASSTADYRISEVSLLLPPSVEVELSAGPGCGGEWRTTQPEVVSLTPERCEGNVSVTTLQTRAQLSSAAVTTTSAATTASQTRLAWAKTCGRPEVHARVKTNFVSKNCHLVPALRF